MTAPGLRRYYGSHEELLRHVIATIFRELFIELWNAGRFPVPGPGEIGQGLHEQLSRLRATLSTDVPDGVLLVFLRCWVLLYGAVAMGAFGHLGFALEDPAPMFEYTLADLARLAGLEYPPPAA